jgi:hypothetical protein
MTKRHVPGGTKTQKVAAGRKGGKGQLVIYAQKPRSLPMLEPDENEG